MSQAQALCVHADPVRFFAPDSAGNQSMMCGDCGVVITLVHSCRVHAVLSVETDDAVIYHAFGDPERECVEGGAMDLETVMSTAAREES